MVRISEHNEQPWSNGGRTDRLARSPEFPGAVDWKASLRQRQHI